MHDGKLNEKEIKIDIFKLKINIQF